MDPSFLVIFPLLLALSTPCNACDCKIQHPQTYYCTSDVVILADIQGPGNNTVTKQGFRVNVIKVLKAPRGIPTIHEIYSPISWKDCSYRLRTTQQSLLLIAGYLRGGTLRFTRCHLVYFWYRLSREQRLGFEAAYRTGCKCQVSMVIFLCSPGTALVPCPCSQIFLPAVSLWMTLALSPSFHSLTSSHCFLSVLSLLTAPFSLSLLTDPCCPCRSRMECMNRKWAVLYLPPPL
uniref:NTR domain-containing protein n=1 Tax=Felis catus TaxID=9685 RepID=A0ABI7WDQ9_FELCA